MVRMQRYLVSGVAGFIANKVAELLLEEGHAIMGVDNLNDAYDVRLKQWRLSRLQGRPGFSFRQMDICDASALENLWPEEGRFDAVVNLAARAGVRQSLVSPEIYVDTNVKGALNLLEFSRKHGVKKFIQASSSSVYGANAVRPYREDGDTTRPLSPYAATKKASEALCYSYYHIYGLDVTVLRYFTVYGPAGRPDMLLFRLVQSVHEGRPITIFGNGSQERDFTYVDDIARGTIAALAPLGYATFNLGSDHPVKVRDCIRLIEELAGNKAILRFKPAQAADVAATWADISQARQRLHWQPEVVYEDGVKRSIQWYKENRDWARDIKTE
jgi:nucleoside-diphosphate-sugar epimerase